MIYWAHPHRYYHRFLHPQAQHNASILTKLSVHHVSTTQRYNKTALIIIPLLLRIIIIVLGTRGIVGTFEVYLHYVLAPRIVTHLGQCSELCSVNVLLHEGVWSINFIKCQYKEIGWNFHKMSRSQQSSISLHLSISDTTTNINSKCQYTKHIKKVETFYKISRSAILN